MKRFICLLLVFLLSLTGCSGQTSQKTLKEHGMDVIALMDEAVKSEAYLQAFTASDNLRTILTDAVGDHTAPSAVLAITFSKTESSIGQDTALPEALTDVMQHKLYAAVSSQINAMGGAKTFAAASLCTMSKTFVSEEISSDVIYLYSFKGGCPVAVTFTTGEDHTVSASGMFLLVDFPTDSIESIVDYLGGFAEVALVA